MRNEIEVNGVKLTREQIEDALKRINEPEEEIIRRGDVFSGKPVTATMNFVMLDKGIVREILKWATGSLELCVDRQGKVHTFDPKYHRVVKKREELGERF